MILKGEETLYSFPILNKNFLREKMISRIFIVL